ncbi:beta-ketoacyl synthase N-terminal-like domain-containing protein, partial [Nocardia cyriacigeorgica]|uniref:beta-ketoacyl synthase N-terminal-like domain-containing protein n=1 Tax=Nocardia cyriacigeorgica TaxID=135487 RepID=UPI002453CE5F
MLEPANEIAIVGMSCRMPGATDLENYWRLLREGRDAVGPAPAARPGNEDIAGYHDTATDFDADYFGIPPAEAKAIDPQQLVYAALPAAGSRVPNELATRTSLPVATERAVLAEHDLAGLVGLGGEG